MRPSDEVGGGRCALAVPLLEDLHVLGALSGFAFLLAAWGYPLWGEAWGAVCVLREVTGIPCPTCYGTRALIAAASGDWITALRFNPLVGAAGVGLIAYIPWAVGTVVGDWPRPSVSPRAVAAAAWLGAGLVFANWIYLIVAHG